MPFMLQVHIAGHPLLVAADEIQAVIHVDAPHPVPATPPSVVGLITLRGAVITVIDPALLLGGNAHVTGPDGSAAIVVRLDGYGYALLCDSADEVFEMAEDEIEPAPAGLAGRWQDVTVGMATAGGHKVAIVDPLRIVPQPAVGAG